MDKFTLVQPVAALLVHVRKSNVCMELISPPMAAEFAKGATGLGKTDFTHMNMKPGLLRVIQRLV